MASTAAALLTLITVTHGGQVFHSEGFPNQRACDEAKSIALTGMTIEQNAAEDAAYVKMEKDRADSWREAHPPRQPTTPADRQIIEDAKNGIVHGGSTRPYSTVGKDGFIYDWPGSGSLWSPSYNPSQGETVVMERGGWVLKHREDIKYAECVIIPPPAKDSR